VVFFNLELKLTGHTGYTTDFNTSIYNRKTSCTLAGTTLDVYLMLWLCTEILNLAIMFYHSKLFHVVCVQRENIELMFYWYAKCA